MKYAIIFSVLMLAGCEQQFRYPCQDPDNWGKAECKKPICEVNKDCPEYIFKNETINVAPKAAPPVKGDCR